MSNPKRKNQRKEGMALVFLRYVAPVAALLVSALWLFIPCMRFTTKDAGTGAVVSAAGLLSNAWHQVREFLFGEGGLSSVNEIFSWTVLILIIVCVLLFLAGAAATVWSSVGALSYLRDGNERGTARALYVTLFPNRIAACAWQAMILPLLAFPRLLLVCYDRILYYPVILNLTFAEPILIGGILYVVTVILCAATRKTENTLGVSPYRVKRSAVGTERTTKEESDVAPLFRAEPQNENESEIERLAREEQAERIRALLTKREETDSDKTNE